jgi:alpha-glucoside transport system substrate-binding protein
VRQALALAAVVGVLAWNVTGCASRSTSVSSPGGGDLRGQTIDVVGVWSGDEQRDFEQVLQPFVRRTGATVRYTSEGDNLPTVLQSKVQGGNPPNIAFLAQPGSIARFANAGALKPLPPDVQQVVAQHQAPTWNDFATVNGKPYGVYFDAENKSVVWYNTQALASVGAQPPATWPDFLSLSSTLADAGTPPMSVGAADGWVLTDWFEQVYLQTAGIDNYTRLSRHQIKWTDPTVTNALRILRQYLGSDRLIAGSRAGALQTDFPTSIVNTFGGTVGNEPKAAMVYEGDFVATTIQSSTKARVGTDAKVFPFPRVGAAIPAVETGGDAAVALTDDRATMELMKFLASPEAGSIFARTGGFLSPNKDVALSDYPNDISRQMEQQLLGAGNNIVFGMSDLAPPAFGATKGSGEWQDLQDFLADPNDITGTEQKLEADATKDYPPG